MRKDIEQEKKIASWFEIFVWLLCAAGLALVIAFAVKAGNNGKFDWNRTFKKALGGGLAGAAAMVLQVLTLMPLRTIMNFQYRFGKTIRETVEILNFEGGFPRYYAGLSAALIQAPLSRFFDTFSNAGILAFMEGNDFLKKLPPFIQTIFVSTAAALFRMILTPIDTIKTTFQTHGSQPGMTVLKNRIKARGFGSMFYGAWATAAATWVGNYPWFATYNSLQKYLPVADTVFGNLCRQAFIGFVASVTSDTVSNFLRVVKTYRQVNETEVGYFEAARKIIEKEGWTGLFFRGLPIKLVCNGLQGIMFSILWKLFQDLWDKKTGTAGVAGYF